MTETGPLMIERPATGFRIRIDLFYEEATDRWIALDHDRMLTPPATADTPGAAVDQVVDRSVEFALFQLRMTLLQILERQLRFRWVARTVRRFFPKSFREWFNERS